MCKFEDCWDIANAQISNDKSIIANIKPEIGKFRPVVIIRPHKRHRLATVVPFTTQTPQKGSAHTVYIPQDDMPGILGKKECWALCDMINTVSLDRLQLPFCGKNNLRTIYRNTILANNKFDDIQKKVLDIFR